MYSKEAFTIQAEGSRDFIQCYSEELEVVLGEKLIHTFIKDSNPSVESVGLWTIKGRYSALYQIDYILSALEKTLQNNKLELELETEIRIENVVFKLNPNTSDAIVNANELIYKVLIDYDGELAEKEKVAISNLVRYCNDTFLTEFYEGTFYTDRYHSASLSKPIPCDLIISMMRDSAYIFEQFASTKTITCEIEASGVVLD